MPGGHGDDAADLPAVEGSPRLGSPLTGIRKFIAIGLNYADHAAESGLPVPAEPIVFMKATSCIQGPNDPVMLPRDSVKTDWEVELGVVIGTRARYVTEAEVLLAVPDPPPEPSPEPQAPSPKPQARRSTPREDNAPPF